MKIMQYTVPKIVLIGIVVTLFFSLFLGNASAKVGVGMGAGEIRLTENVKPGGIYEIPPLRIFNTGTEVTTYGMGVAYHQENLELRPAKDWFIFNPLTFTIEPKNSEKVGITMMVPLKAKPGDYFAFIEAGPVASNEAGTSVGIAVAAKLYFTVEPANVIQAMFYRTGAFFERFSPWSWILLVIIILSTLIIIARRFISFDFNLKIKK